MISIVLILLMQMAHATDFTSAFLAFEMPDGFTCKKNIGTYICLREAGPKMKDEIIVVSFKRAGPQDTMEQYRSQMRQPRTIRNKDKMSVLSTVLSSGDISANGVPWIEARHLSGEIEDYYTTYWATKTGGVGMLISYTVQKIKKADWLRASEIIRNSLSVDGSATNAIADQVQTAHPDLDGPSGAEGNRAANPLDTNGNGTSSPHMFGMDGMIAIGGVTLKKSHFFLGIAALVALILMGAALKR